MHTRSTISTIPCGKLHAALPGRGPSTSPTTVAAITLRVRKIECLDSTGKAIYIMSDVFCRFFGYTRVGVVCMCVV